MRAETKQKLDALERAQTIRKGLLVALLGAILIVGAFAYTQPRTFSGYETATVTRSVVGRDHWGQPFHNLTVRLENGETRPVETFLVPRPLPAGKILKLEKWSGFWGNVVYRIAQTKPPNVSPPLTR